MDLPIRPRRFAVLVALVALTGCDAGGPAYRERLVVEAFFDTDRPLPDVWVRRTLGPGETADADGVAGAAVALTTPDGPVALAAVPGRPGLYRPAVAGVVAARGAYGLTVTAGAHAASAATLAPPRFAFDSVRVVPAAQAVRSVLLDSLRLGSGGAIPEGFVYPVEVRAYWRVGYAEAGADSAYWVRASLRPTAAAGGRFFFPAEALLRERTVPNGPSGGRAWSGVYAVPVAAETDPLPAHRVRVAVLRAGADYARFAAGLGASDGRAPVGNVAGALGLVAGVSVDSVTVEVRPR